MSEDWNKAQLRRFYEEVFNKGNLDVVDDLATEGFVDHESLPGAPVGRPGVKWVVNAFRWAFPNIHFEVQEMIAEGEKVASRAVITGTHEGDFMGLAPTGRRFRVETIDIVRFEDDRAAEHWGITDQAALLQQLGIMPS